MFESFFRQNSQISVGGNSSQDHKLEITHQLVPLEMHLLLNH